MVRFSNGFYTFSDSYLKSMRKQDLINYIRTIEKNWENQLITNDIQYNNCKRLLVEERAKAIDDLTEKLMTDVESFVGEVNGIRADLLTLDYFCEFVGDTAEQMKGGAE